MNYAITISQIEGTTTNVKLFGARGNGISDDSAAIQKAINYISVMGSGTVIIPEGQYLIRNNIILKNKVNLVGVKGRSELIFDDTFNGVKEDSGTPKYQPAIWNEHKKNTYDQATADGFLIKDIVFRKHTNIVDFNTVLFLRNTNGVVIDGCKFDISGTTAAVAIYAHGCNYNLSLINNEFINLTGANESGGVWICNLTDNPNEINKTFNVHIENNTFVIKSGSESLAIYGRDGLIKKAVILNNKFTTLKDAIISQSKVLSLYGRTSATGRENAGVEDITVSNNFFEIEEIDAFVISVGSINSSTDIINNVLIDSNIIKFKTEMTTPSGIGIAGYEIGQSYNVTVSNNKIMNYGSHAVRYGIYNIKNVNSNILTGTFSQAAISNCNLVINNYISDNLHENGWAIRNSFIVRNNVINNCNQGIAVSNPGHYSIVDNTITLSGSASAVGVYTLTSNSVDYIKGNIIYQNNANSIAFKLYSGQITMIDNAKFGDGKYIDGTVVLVRAYNNRIDDLGYDTSYPGRITDNEVQDALPIGHIIWISNAMTNEVGLWKKAPGNGADKWESIKFIK